MILVLVDQTLYYADSDMKLRHSAKVYVSHAYNILCACIYNKMYALYHVCMTNGKAFYILQGPRT